MIPLQKLFKLPRSQMLRKAAKIIGEAERRFAISEEPGAGEIEYLKKMTELLVKNGGFSEAAGEILGRARSGFGAPAREGNSGEIRRALNTFYHLLLAETGRYPSDWDFIGTSGSLDPSGRRPFPGMEIYLEDIRSPFNVGSMFRAAESFGAEKVWLSPFCADPRHKRAERTAMGCVDILPWERLPREPFTRELFADDIFNGQEETAKPEIPFTEGPFFAMETGGTPLEDFSFPSAGILIAGSEELGVSPRALAKADASLGRVSIITRGAKGSLNVSVAFGIVMHAWASALRRRKES